MDKCFDRISYAGIYGALRYFNFGETFIQWVSLFYTDFQVCTQNFGFFSDFFSKGRSVNQGCIISPAIFLLTSEILANKLRNNDKIKGIKIKDVEHLISQFADDIDIYLPYDETILNETLKVISDIEVHTGLKASYDKTTIYRIGSIANTDAKCYTFRKVKWTNDPVNTLGLDLYMSEKEMLLNYDKIVEKLLAITEIWQYRSLTIMGKVLVVNTLMASLFVYKLQVLPYIPEPIFTKIESAIEHFIWNGKRPKIILQSLKKEKWQGSLGLVDLHTKHESLLINWVIVTQNNYQCLNLAKYFLGCQVENNLIWKFNLSPRHVEKHFCHCGFWYYVLRAWSTHNFQIPQNGENIRQQIVWYNSNITIKGDILLPLPGFSTQLTINDLADNKTFFSVKDFQEARNTTVNWLHYQSLVQAIPPLLENCNIFRHRII